MDFLLVREIDVIRSPGKPIISESSPLLLGLHSSALIEFDR